MLGIGIDIPKTKKLNAGGSAVYPSFVAASKATTPPTETSGNAGTTVIVDVPPGTMDGHMMIATIQGSAHTPPAEWNLLFNNSSAFIYWRVADSEPASYTWTAFTSGTSRNGAIVSIKDANPVLGDSDSVFQQLDGATFNLPDLTVDVENSLVVAFAVTETNSTNENFVSTAPLIDKIQHACNGSIAYSLPYGIIMAIEEGLSAGTWSGRTFTNPSTDELFKICGGIIIKPV